MEKNINKSKMEELRLLILNTACYSALIITSAVILLTVLSSLLSKKIILADYSKQSFEVNELLKFLVFYPVGEELLLRGLMFHFLKKKTKYANLIQALIFGILHLNPIQNMPIITLIIIFIPPLFIFDYTLKQLKNKFNYEKLYKA